MSHTSPLPSQAFSEVQGFSEIERSGATAGHPEVRSLAAQRAHLAVVTTGTSPEPVTPRAVNLGHTPIWEPSTSISAPRGPAIPTSSEVLARTVAPDSLPPELEHAMIAVLTRPVSSGEGHQLGNDHRERELCALIATLDLHQAYHLGRRLDLERTTDALAQAFRRMVIERRQRVRRFVADARRRQMLAR